MPKQNQLNELGSKLSENNLEYFKYYSDLADDGKTKSLEMFEKNGGIMLSIKCLDEGVDIPAADYFILAYPQTYAIQRRGRVLRIDKQNYKKSKHI